MTTKPFSELTKNISQERKAAIAAETARLLKEIESSKTNQQQLKELRFIKA
jgi:hypothetical protein